jgi:serine/threonine protein kinase
VISPGLRIGRYEVGKRLGKGGFGVVHLARDLDLDRDVAIKVLKSEYAARPQIVQRFIKEARAAAKIGHAGIVTVFECSQIQNTGTHADGNAYIAMELLVGESLADRLLNGGRMSLAQTLAITRQLAAALAAAHTAQIVHRDLKPDNVFLVPDAAVHGGERVKVLDFGVAKLMDGEDGVNTHSQMMLGTPKYMSPEQARSAAKADWRADIYTLGCMVFEMLTGRTPFSGDTGDQIIAHQKAPVPSPREVNASVPPALDALVRRMLAKSPDDRPQAMQDIVDALADLGDEPDTVVRAPIDTTKRTSAEITTVAEPITNRNDPRPRFLAFGIGAALLAMLVVFVVMRRGSKPLTPPPPKPVPVVVVVDAGIDAAVVVVIVPDAAEIDDRLLGQCFAERDARRWSELIACAERLRPVDKLAGDDLYRQGHAELQAEATLRALTTAMRDGSMKRARMELDVISEDSVYRLEATKLYADAASQAVDRLAARLRQTKSCKEHEKLLTSFAKAVPADIVNTAATAAPCNTSPQPLQECNADVLMERGSDALASQDAPAATKYFEAAYKCRPSIDAFKRVALMACKTKNILRVQALFKKTADVNLRDFIKSTCANNGVMRETFDSL